MRSLVDRVDYVDDERDGWLDWLLPLFLYIYI